MTVYKWMGAWKQKLTNCLEHEKHIDGGENVFIVDCAFHKTTKYTSLYMIYNKK